MQKEEEGNSLDIQWLRLLLPMQGVGVRSLVAELRSHMPPGQKKRNIKQKQYCYKLNKEFKMFRIKKSQETREKEVQFHVVLLHSQLKCVRKVWTMLT